MCELEETVCGFLLLRYSVLFSLNRGTPFSPCLPGLPTPTKQRLCRGAPLWPLFR